MSLIVEYLNPITKSRFFDVVESNTLAFAVREVNYFAEAYAERVRLNEGMAPARLQWKLMLTKGKRVMAKSSF